MPTTPASCLSDKLRRGGQELIQQKMQRKNPVKKQGRKTVRKTQNKASTQARKKCREIKRITIQGLFATMQLFRLI